MATGFAVNTEPTLCEVLDDPIVQVLMARDGVARKELEGLIEQLKYRLAPTRDAGCEGSRSQKHIAIWNTCQPVFEG